MKIKAGELVEIVLYASPVNDMDFFLFIEDLMEKYPYWRWQNPSYRIIEQKTT